MYSILVLTKYMYVPWNTMTILNFSPTCGHNESPLYAQIIASKIIWARLLTSKASEKSNSKVCIKQLLAVKMRPEAKANVIPKIDLNLWLDEELSSDWTMIGSKSEYDDFSMSMLI